MYTKAKSYNVLNNEHSDYICKTGVRQDKKLLFACTLMTWKVFFNDRGTDGIQTCTNNISRHAGIFIRLMVLLYANDTVILVDCVKHLQ